MRRAIAITILALTAGLTLTARARHQDVARFSARSVEMTSAARLSFRRIDIAISQWSTDQDHRLLARTILERGPAGVLDLLCGYPSLGTIAVAGGSEIAIRYAWRVPDAEGGERIYLASDEPISLMGSHFNGIAYPPFYFVELRLDRHGDGMGKLSDNVRLSVDQGRNVIELRDYDRRPLQLVMVHDEMGE